MLFTQFKTTRERDVFGSTKTVATAPNALGAGWFLEFTSYGGVCKTGVTTIGVELGSDVFERVGGFDNGFFDLLGVFLGREEVSVVSGKAT
jgi:hypothetical protein